MEIPWNTRTGIPASEAWILRSTWVVADMVSPAVMNPTLMVFASDMMSSHSSTWERYRMWIFLPMTASRSSGLVPIRTEV